MNLMLLTRQALLLLTIVIGATVMSACVPNTADQTLAAEYYQSGTLIVDMRMTGTVQVARMQTTLDFASTRVAFAGQQSRSLQSTMVAMGFDQSSIDQFQQDVTGGSVVLPSPTPNANTSNFSVQQPTAQAPAQAPTPQAATNTPDPTAPRMENVAIAADVGDDDCALGTASQFTMDSQIVYLTARIFNTPANTTFTARWVRPDGQERSFDWTPDFAIDNSCIWMYIDQTDEPFVTGVWNATLSINGNITSDALSFRIDDVMADG
ncbi:MAG: hypothetical protein CL607_25275 [Anaerolineaceae bacterium]|nr:hypothetical protein [Anaerolineaceae bacterium]